MTSNICRTRARRLRFWLSGPRGSQDRWQPVAMTVGPSFSLPGTLVGCLGPGSQTFDPEDTPPCVPTVSGQCRAWTVR